MKNGILTGIILLFACINAVTQDTATIQQPVTLTQEDTSYPPAILKSKPIGPIYNYRPGISLPITAVAAGWSGYAFTKIYSKPNSTTEEIYALDKNDINKFDRWVAGNYDEKMDKFSYLPFYVAVPLPLFLLIDKEIRKDAGKVMLMYLEAISITGFFYTGSTYLTNRYRPFAYGADVPIEKRTSGGAKNSFLAGHTAVIATSTFFTAKVYADYHPESNIRWLLYSGAALSTAWMTYMRLRSGHHFPTDIIAGIALGVGSGMLVPTFHKNKLLKRHDISLFPFSGESHGVAMIYRFR